MPTPLRLLCLLGLTACVEERDPTYGACEMQYSVSEDYSEVLRFCMFQEEEFCLWAQSAHGQGELGFFPFEPCEASGYTVCCTSPEMDVWFETAEEAEHARQVNTGRSCVPCPEDDDLL